MAAFLWTPQLTCCNEMLSVPSGCLWLGDTSYRDTFCRLLHPLLLFQLFKEIQKTFRTLPPKLSGVVIFIGGTAALHYCCLFFLKLENLSIGMSQAKSIFFFSISSCGYIIDKGKY